MEDITQSKYLTQEKLNSILKVARKRGKESSKINFGFLAYTFHTHPESELELVSGRLQSTFFAMNFSM